MCVCVYVCVCAYIYSATLYANVVDVANSCTTKQWFLSDN